MMDAIRDYIAFLHFKRTQRAILKSRLLKENSNVLDQEVETRLKKAWGHLTKAKHQEFFKSAKAYNQQELQAEYWADVQEVNLNQQGGQEASWPKFLPFHLRDGNTPSARCLKTVDALILNLSDLADLLNNSSANAFTLITRNPSDHYRLVDVLSNIKENPRKLIPPSDVRVQVYFNRM